MLEDKTYYLGLTLASGKEREYSEVWSESKVPMDIWLERVKVICRGKDTGGKWILNDKQELANLFVWVVSNF